MQKPARLYRNAVRQLCTQYTPSKDVDADLDFLSYLASNYDTEKARLESAIAAGTDEPDWMRSRGAQFVLAAGLLAFGRIDVAEDLLDYLPTSGGIRKLALGLQALLPLPDELHPWRDPEAIRIWLWEHKDQLRWDEAQGIYVASHGEP